MYQTYDLINNEIKDLSFLYPNTSYLDINMSIDNVDEAVFTDHMHLTSFGNELIAKEIKKILN